MTSANFLPRRSFGDSLRPLRIQAAAGFVLRWTTEWREVHDSPTAVEIEFVDIDVPKEQRAPLRFTIYWPQEDRWEGQDFQVAVT